MTAAEASPADVLKESVFTADFARNAQAREVAAWTLTRHPDLPIAQHWRRLEDRYITLSRAYVGLRQATPANLSTLNADGSPR